MAARAGPAPASSHDHVVKVYDDDPDLVSGVSEYVVAGLIAGDLVVVVATPEHRVAVADAVSAAGIDLAIAAANGQYLALDARETVASFMVGGVPDRLRFKEVIGRALVGAGRRDVRIFGEMVAVLWDDGDVSGAIAVESLWNDLATEHSFSLYCAYALASFAGADLTALRDVCAHHDAIEVPESYVGSSVASGSASEITNLVEEIFLPVPLAVRAARRFVEQVLRAWGEDEIVGNAKVVVSELAANAVRHARSPFRVSVSRSGGNVRVAVTDVGRGAPVPRASSPESVGGRGLALVAAVSRAWGTEAVPEAKVVWVDLAPEANAEPVVTG